ncbi:MAG: ABC transporter permease, partial [Psychrosphaera sp.]|nr:ABC transporter permease [Psychrosphaera sp.]
ATFMASVVGMIPETSLGAHSFALYMTPYVSFVLVNILWSGAIFFTLATLLRKMMPVYIGSLIMLIGWLVSSVAVNSLDTQSTAAMIDPFGLEAVSNLTKYWSIAEKNTLLVGLDGSVLLNRLLWLAIGFISLVWCYFRFDFVEALPGKKLKKDQKSTVASKVRAIATVTAKSSYGKQLFNAFSLRQALFSMVKLELLQTLKNRYFVVLLLGAVGFMAFAANNLGVTFGTETYPTTYMITDMIGGGFQMFILVVIVFYAGELVWREKDTGIKQVSDAMPVPQSFAFVAKFIGLMSVVSLLLLIVLCAGVLIQVANGYYEFDLSVYFTELFVINFSRALLLATLAMFIQVIIGNKYAAHGVMILVYMATVLLPRVGIDNMLLLYGNAPSVMYSDMNGYGTYLAPHLWFKAYWLAFAVILVQVSILMWPHGEDEALKNRLKNARFALNAHWKKGFAASGLTFAALVLFLGYNTLVVNPQLSRDERIAKSVNYESNYRKTYQKMSQPSITEAEFDLQIYASERSLKLAGVYTMQNLQQHELQSIFINLPADLTLQALSADRDFTVEVDDVTGGVQVLKFAKALQPGEQFKLNFSFDFAQTGISAKRQAARLFQNGTFLDISYFPTIGFNRDRLAQSQRIRDEFNLGELPQLAAADDKKAQMQSGFSGDTHWVTNHYTVSTDKGQTAIAPGELEKQWVEGDRAHFVYRGKRATVFYPAVISARFEVKTAKWNDVDIKVYHHARHTYNLDTMIRGVQKSLDVFTTEFGEYPFDHVRIIEFPRFSRFAQSYPGTIPYSEAIGFIARVDNSKDTVIDYPFFVTAHEMAHQWWPHQTSVSATKGANMLSETLAQYSALLVMESEYGVDNMREFLRYSTDRYLSGRGSERNEEVALVNADDQSYVLYDKGGVVMYMLRDYVGGDVLNKILREYLNEFKYAGTDKAYPTSVGLVNRIKRNIPQQYQYLIADWFENITLMDIRTTEAKTKALDNGKHEVTLKGVVNKNRFTGIGESTTVDMNDLIDVVVFDEKGEVIYLQKHRFEGGDFELTVTVDGKPAKAGVDSFHKLIDRVPDDNSVEVVAETP